jgi:urease subunit alpha
LAPERRIRLADTSLELVPERDLVGGPDRLLPGFGNTMRDGLGVRAERGGVDFAIVGGTVLDPVLGVQDASLGVRDGRIVAIGRAGNPDTMDGIEVVLDTQTAVVDATGLIVTPGGVDPHVHWLSPQVCDAALAGGLTTLVIQDYGPVWNLGNNPESGLAATWAALDAYPLNAALLVRASSSRPEPVEESLRAGGGGLKIHEDVAAGPEQIRCALDVADRFDVQLAIHTDGLNEALGVEDTAAAFAGRTVHAYHIEGAGGGHAPNLLDLAGRPNVLTSSTAPTVPYTAGAYAESAAMIGAVHVMAPGRTPGDATALRLRARASTMAAESVLHDLGVIAMLSSDSQGMGRVGELFQRAFQLADAMKRLGAGDAALSDNERALRYLAKVTINPALTHGLAHDVGSLEVGKLADAVLWQPAFFAIRPELIVKSGIPAWGASGSGSASTMVSLPAAVGPQVGALAGAAARLSTAFVAEAALSAELPTARRRSAVRGCRRLGAADMVRNSRTGEVRVDPATLTVTLSGEPVAIDPIGEIALSRRYLLG